MKVVPVTCILSDEDRKLTLAGALETAVSPRA